VLDPFVGGGTTAVEAALLGRRVIAGDVTAAAIAATRTQLDPVQRRRSPPARPALVRHDARALAVADRSMHLVLLHPPYADAIRYSADTAGDLSHLAAGPFLTQLRHVAAESLRVLAPGGRCALLIGDLRRQGHVVPLGFATIQAFRHAGLVLDELIMKRQHHTRTEARWSGISAQRGFLLLAHEYLAVFRRANDPAAAPVPAVQVTAGVAGDRSASVARRTNEAGETTAWVVPGAQMDTALPELAHQLWGTRGDPTGVCFVRTPQLVPRAGVDTPAVLARWLDQVLAHAAPGGVLAVETRDVRIGGELQPLGLEVCRALRRRQDLRLKEIIAVMPAEDVQTRSHTGDRLAITHRYLLVASRGTST
jgi:hypothetical protein